MKMGIIGCSEIVSRAIIEPAKEIDNLEVYGISSRTKEKAQIYSERFHIPKAFDSYEDLLESSDIDFVYVVLANDLHLKWTLKAIEAGKHVLVEKPLCLNSKEFSLLNKAIEKSNKVYLLEGLMVQHHPWQRSLKDIINSKKYGKLLQTKTHISFTPKYNVEGNYRSFPERGGGAFYDLGCYWLQFIQSISDKKPTRYEGRSNFDGPNGCDWTFNSYMEFSKDFRAELICSFEMPYKAEHVLVFEEAEIIVDDFFRANLGNYKINLKVYHKNGTKERISFSAENYYKNQLEFFCDVIMGKKENISLYKSQERIELFEAIFASAKEYYASKYIR